MTQDGYDVYGIGRTFPELVPFHPLVCDLLDTRQLLQLVDAVRSERDISVLVLCAGTAYYGLHEEISPSKISEMVRVNLESPLILTQHLLRDLKRAKGTILLLSSVTAEHAAPRACAYGATKAGLSAFGKSLFEEARKYGVRVITVQPDLTDTQLYRHADFQPEKGKDTCLDPQDIAAAVLHALHAPFVVSEITLRPQLNRISKKNRSL